MENISRIELLFPCCDLRSRLEQIRKPTRVQALTPQLPVETLHIRVLHRPPRFDVHQLDLPFHPTPQKMPARKFRFVVAPNRFRNSALRPIRSSSRVTLRLAKPVSTSSARKSKR